jgi:hypothetical protein
MTRWLWMLTVGALLIGPLSAPAQDRPATKEEIEEVRGILDGLNESATEYRNYVDALRKIKISGYVQPQFRYTKIDNQSYDIGTFSGGPFPRYSKNVFQLRRARLKVMYDNVVTQFVVQFDLAQTGLGLKDAYLWLADPWVHSFGLTMGIFDRPFGYEISFSSGSRESPERSRVFQTLFPGERDLGAKFSFAPQLGSLSFLKAEVGLTNGTGPTSVEFDNFKDIIGRVGVQLPFQDAGAELDLGLSGYFGNARGAVRDVYAMGKLASGDPGFLKNSDTANVGNGFSRRYVGTDAQFYFDVPSLGGLILRGEYIAGDQPGLARTSVSISAPVSEPLYLRPFAGWYVNLIQNIGVSDQLVVKYDVYDPNTDVKGSEFVSGANLTSADLCYRTLGLGLVHHWDENIKFLLYYEIVRNETVTPAAGSSLSAFTGDVRDNVLTFRTQYKF